MRIADRIARKILTRMESCPYFKLFEINEEDNLDLECMIADTIKKELNYWLSWDTDLQKVEE